MVSIRYFSFYATIISLKSVDFKSPEGNADIDLRDWVEKLIPPSIVIVLKLCCGERADWVEELIEFFDVNQQEYGLLWSIWSRWWDGKSLGEFLLSPL